MSVVIVQTDDGREVSRFEVPDIYQGNGIWRDLLGRLDTPLGWLGRTLSDARVIQEGGDPERTSEKVMRILSARWAQERAELAEQQRREREALDEAEA